VGLPPALSVESRARLRTAGPAPCWSSSLQSSDPAERASPAYRAWSAERGCSRAEDFHWSAVPAVGAPMESRDLPSSARGMSGRLAIPACSRKKVVPQSRRGPGDFDFNDSWHCGVCLSRTWGTRSAPHRVQTTGRRLVLAAPRTDSGRLARAPRWLHCPPYRCQGHSSSRSTTDVRCTDGRCCRLAAYDQNM